LRPTASGHPALSRNVSLPLGVKSLRLTLSSYAPYHRPVDILRRHLAVFTLTPYTCVQHLPERGVYYPAKRLSFLMVERAGRGNTREHFRPADTRGTRWLRFRRRVWHQPYCQRQSCDVGMVVCGLTSNGLRRASARRISPRSCRGVSPGRSPTFRPARRLRSVYVQLLTSVSGQGWQRGWLAIQCLDCRLPPLLGPGRTSSATIRARAPSRSSMNGCRTRMQGPNWTPTPHPRSQYATLTFILTITGMYDAISRERSSTIARHMRNAPSGCARKHFPSLALGTTPGRVPHGWKLAGSNSASQPP